MITKLITTIMFVNITLTHRYSYFTSRY